MSIECLAVGDPYIQGENGPYHELKRATTKPMSVNNLFIDKI